MLVFLLVSHGVPFNPPSTRHLLFLVPLFEVGLQELSRETATLCFGCHVNRDDTGTDATERCGRFVLPFLDGLRGQPKGTTHLGLPEPSNYPEKVGIRQP